MSPGDAEPRPGFSRAVWDLFRAVRLTVFLLAVLAVVAIAGTVVPQGSAPRAYELIYGEFGALLVRVAGLDDAYHSTWFLLLLTGLWLNLLACTWDRLPAVLRRLGGPVPGSAAPGQVQGALARPDGAAADVAERLQRALPGGWKGAVRWSEDADRPAGIAAARGRAGHLAFPLTHLSLMLILVGGLVSAIFAVEGRLRLLEGQSSDRFAAQRLGSTVITDSPLGFTVRCDEARADKDPATGRPIQYRSTLTVIDGGVPALQQTISVNTPLHYGGWTFYQSEYDERMGPGGKLRRLTGLQVARDPGAWWVWTGCGLLMVGLVLALMVRPERLQIDVVEQELRVHLSGKGGREALQRSLDEVLAALAPGSGERSEEP